MGFSFSAFFFFVLITSTTDLDYDSEHPSICSADFRPFSCLMSLKRLCFSLTTVRLVLSVVIGVAGGVILLMSWWRFGSVMGCVIVVGLMLGFVVASVILFTPLGTKNSLFSVRC